MIAPDFKEFSRLAKQGNLVPVYETYTADLLTPVGAYLRILADALTSCALFAIGLGLSIQGLRANFGRAATLTVVKLVIIR